MHGRAGRAGVADSVDHDLAQVGWRSRSGPSRAAPAAACLRPAWTFARPRTRPATSRTPRRSGSFLGRAWSVPRSRGCCQRVAQFVRCVGHELPHPRLGRLARSERLLDVVEHVVERLPDRPTSEAGLASCGTRTARATSPRSSFSWDTCWAVAATRFSGRRLRTTGAGREYGPATASRKTVLPGRPVRGWFRRPDQRYADHQGADGRPPETIGSRPPDSDRARSG